MFLCFYDANIVTFCRKYKDFLVSFCKIVRNPNI